MVHGGWKLRYLLGFFRGLFSNIKTFECGQKCLLDCVLMQSLSDINNSQDVLIKRLLIDVSFPYDLEWLN